MRRFINGLDEMALEVTYTAVAAILGAVVLWLALNSAAAARTASVPLVGPAVGGARSLVNLVVHP